MSAELHRKESLDYYPTLSAPLVSGYHFLAKPAVTLMRKNKVAARFFASGATAYAKHTTGDKNLLGCIIKNLGEPLCYLAGKTLSLFLATPLALKAS